MLKLMSMDNLDISIFDREIKRLLITLDKLSHSGQIQNVKTEFLGKKSLITQTKNLISKESVDLKRKFFPQIQSIEKKIKDLISQKINNLNFTSEITTPLPVYEKIGKLHLIPHSKNQIKSIFNALNFNFFDSPEIETAKRNFTLLNTEERHPCRSEHQSFSLNNQHILRTQTTTIQSYLIPRDEDKASYFTIGRVYRRDSDSTHTPMFHQIEILKVGNDCNIQSLLEILFTFLNSFFEKELKYRIRPSFFPFTEPSFEVDIHWNGRWLEVLGMGMVHEEIFKKCKVKNKKAFAAGMGLERLCMIKYGIKDIRNFYDSKEYNTHISVFNGAF